MTRKYDRLPPQKRRVLEKVGENLRLARLRRRLSAQQVAERAGISRNTLYLLEKGSGRSSISTLLMVLHVLGLEKDILLLAADDVLGRKLEDARLTTPRKRAPKRPRPKSDERPGSQSDES